MSEGDPMKRFRPHWERIRKKGMLRFVLLRGVLGWGVFTAALYTLVMHFFFPPFPWSMFPECLARMALFGIAFGAGLRYFGEWCNRQT